MSLVIKGDSFGEVGPGDLQMLLLRLDREDEVEDNGPDINTLGGSSFASHTSTTSASARSPPPSRFVPALRGTGRTCACGR